MEANNMKRLGLAITMIGARLWQPAFNEDRADNYKALKFKEKLGYHIVALGIKMTGVKLEDVRHFTK